MKAIVLPEPELEFGDGGRHEDVRFGILNHGLLTKKSQPERLDIGIVGTQESIEGARDWIERCKTEIPAKESTHTNLFPYFPGISLDSPFGIELHVPDNATCQLSEAALMRSYTKGGDLAIREIVEQFVEGLENIDEKAKIAVVICALPSSILGYPETASAVDPTLDFRALLKARVMGCRFSVQLLQPVTYGEKGTRSLVLAKRGTYQQRGLQDEATRAWNFFVALVYKAGFTPWRLAREANDYESCYVGIGFYKSLDNARMLTSMAQVFNERGQGMVLRGAPVELTKEDRQPHLRAEDANELLSSALDKYRTEHRHLPARVVVHKTSLFSQAEVNGFESALGSSNVELRDFLYPEKSGVRLFRHGNYPVLRGTFLKLDDANSVLFTRGSCQFYQTYTGMYVPRAIRMRVAQHDSSHDLLANEMLALTKLNWNTTQLDGAFPITIRAARRVGEILKHVSEDEIPKSQYSYYM